MSGLKPGPTQQRLFSQPVKGVLFQENEFFVACSLLLCQRAERSASSFLQEKVRPDASLCKNQESKARWPYNGHAIPEGIHAENARSASS